MPRVKPLDILRARAINKLLPSLLPVCRELNAACNELRWLQEHATFVSQRDGNVRQNVLLQSFVQRRNHGEPLQYILGSEFFGDLEIKCRAGVLIPRQETAASVSHLGGLLRPAGAENKLRILDLCTGSGCIALLFHHEFYKSAANQEKHLKIVGVDVSPNALSLARENLLHQIANSSQPRSTRTSSLSRISFVQADILHEDEHHNEVSSESPSLLRALQRLQDDHEKPTFDVLISNPPYISPKSFRSTTARSVRDFEPKLALVPPQSQDDFDDGDVFYPRLLQVAEQVNAKIVLFEVADLAQAKRVANLMLQQGMLENVEIWRDEPDHTSLPDQIQVGSQDIAVRGRGHGRSVFGWRNMASSVLGSLQNR